MGKKGGLFSAIKRVFSPHSKEKLSNQEPERKSGNENKKKGFGKLRHGQTNSFLPIFREPSSIEKILGEAERDHNLVFRPPTPPDRSHPSSVSPPPPPPRPTSPRPTSPRVASPPPRFDSPRSFSPKPSDRSKQSSASANAPPPRPTASTQVPSQRIAPPIVPSPRPVSPRVASSQVVSQRPPSPRPTSPRVASPQAVSQKPPSPKPVSPRVATSQVVSQKPPSPRSTSPGGTSSQVVSQKPSTPRPTSPRVASLQAVPRKPPSPREDPLSLDTQRPPSPREFSPREEPPSVDTLRPPSRKPPSPRLELPRLDAPRPTTPRPPSPKTVSPRAVQRRLTVSKPEPTPLVQYTSATKIQATFRGYMARKSFRAMKGLVRLQGVVKGYGVKRQTISAMKYMQKLVRVQSHIQSRRIKMLENQAQAEKDKSRLAASEAGSENWDDSVLTKEERDARSQRKVDAIIKRERSMAYAYSHKLWKNSPKSTQDINTTGGLPLWWNWVDRQLPQASPVPSHSQPLRDYRQTPTRMSPSPVSQTSNNHRFRHDNNFDPSTPKSSRSTLLTPSRPFGTSTSRYSRGRLRGQDSPFKDDDSLTSCPPFPSYMAPTVSAKAKARPNSNPRERVMGSPSVSSETRRMSYPPMQQGLDMFRWNKGSLLMSNNKGPGSPSGVVLEKHKTLKSVGNLSIDSNVSTSTLGRRAFNRYV